jgi:acyl-CoA hydrolase
VKSARAAGASATEMTFTGTVKAAPAGEVPAGTATASKSAIKCTITMQQQQQYEYQQVQHEIMSTRTSNDV